MEQNNLTLSSAATSANDTLPIEELYQSINQYQPPMLRENTSRTTSHSLSDYSRIGNVDDDSISTFDLRHFSVPSRGSDPIEENIFLESDQSVSQMSKTPSTSPLPLHPDDLIEKWTSGNYASSCTFPAHESNWKHYGALSETDFCADQLSARVSPDAIAMTHNSPSALSTLKVANTCERIDPFMGGFTAGIAEFPRNRGGSMGSDASLPLSAFSDHHDDRLRIEVPFRNDHGRGGEIDDLERAGQNLLAGLSAPQSVHYPSPFGSWLGGRDEEYLESRYREGTASSTGRSSRGTGFGGGGLSLLDLPQDFQACESQAFSTGPSSRDELSCYSRDSRPSHSPAYSQSASPVRDTSHRQNQGPYIRRDSGQDIHYKSNAPVKNQSLPQFVPEDYIHGNSRHVLNSHDVTSFDQGLQLTDGNIYQVQFKRCYRCFKLLHDFPLPIKLGEFVIVEADRGEDLGVVVAIAPSESPLSVSIYAASALSMRMTDNDFSKKILRIATMQERLDLPFKKQQEMILLEVCRERARDLHSLPITLIDAEYQFDRNKLVLHYGAARRIDFREFVRDLFAVYKTRIWMEQVHASSNFTPSGAVAVALQTGHLHLNPLVPQPQWNSGDVSPAYSPSYSPRVERRKVTTNTTQYPRREFYGQQNFQAQQESQYQQNLKLQEMRLAQHPHRQCNRFSEDQKCKELQLQKERELNEEFDRGVADALGTSSLPFY